MIQNQHDKFVRASFSNPERAKAFFNQFLPEDIKRDLDLNSLRVVKESYLSNDLKEYFSDLVFEIDMYSDKSEEMEIVLLFEHKSSVITTKWILKSRSRFLFRSRRDEGAEQ